MDKRTYCLVSGTIFGVVAVLHVVRLVKDWDVEIGPIEIPRLMSVPGAIISGALATWGFQLAKKRTLASAIREKFA
jgi:hypothetical protein